MLAFIFRRLLQSVFVVFAMSIITFVGVYKLGNPIEILISPQADQEEKAAAIARLGLDQPFLVQLWTFLKNLAQGDLGKSFVHGTNAVELILGKMTATLELTLFAFLITLLVGVPLGMIAGRNPHSLKAKTIKTLSTLGFSLPNFWFGIILILVFAVTLRWLPAGGRGAPTPVFGLPFTIFSLSGLMHVLLPALTLAIYKTSLVIRLSYNGTREALMMDYVKYARAKGISENQILFTHVLKNILIPIVTILGLELGSMIAFAVVTEKVFAWPGMGKLLIDSIFSLDRPVIVAYLMIIVMMFVVINLFVDILYSLLDPRVRLEGKE